MVKKITLAILVAILSLSQLMADEVTVSGREILVNNKPFIIKGVCYNPVPKGSSDRNFANISTDLALMNEAGINTIRVYSPIDDEAVLDKIAAAGIKVITSFGYNQGGYYDILSGSFMDYIEKYKDHDAILLWEFGNEYNYHPEWFDNDINNWYNALNQAAADAKLEDYDHPISTAHGEMPNITALNSCTEVDVWGLNVYRWDNPKAIFSEWEKASSKPMFLSEAGADSFMKAAAAGYEAGENEKAQADATKKILTDVFDASGICSGVTLFEYSDEWWKAGNPNTHDEGGWAPNSSGVPYDGAPNEEYWGIVDVDGNKKEAFEVVKAIYTSITIAIENEVNYQTLSIYPNPVENNLNIYHLPENCDKIEVLDITGKVYFTYQNISTNTVKKSVSSLPQGIYFIKTYGNMDAEVMRFIKK